MIWLAMAIGTATTTRRARTTMSSERTMTPSSYWVMLRTGCDR